MSKSTKKPTKGTKKRKYTKARKPGRPAKRGGSKKKA